MGRFDYTADDDTHQEIERVGRKLLSPLKGKDNLLKLLKSAGESLAEAAQNSEGAKLAARDLAKALGRPEFLRHKDKEVQLYTALGICHILRLNAPDTPYTDEQLQLIFDLFNRVYAELEDSASPHFQLCMSILETVAQVKCSLLILDLPNGEELVCSLFNTLLDAINVDNADALEGTVLELLRGMIEEADDLPQPQLDALLSRLLPSAAAQAPAAHALVAALLQRTETTVQPHLQRFLKALLTGSRTDSELRDNAYELFYAVHETVPQALLPLEPQLRAELEEEADAGKRRAAVELASKLLAARPGSRARLLDEYEPLLGALLGRSTDADATVRRKVLEAAGDLMEACAGRPQQQAEVLRAAVGRLHDPDDAVRRAAVGAVCRLLQLHPGLARSTNTDGRGPVLSLAYQRLRDKKLSVRREAASQLAALLRAWIAAAEEDPAAAPEPRVMLSLPLVVCNCAVRDPELGAHVFDTVWRAGMFPAKMAPAAVARYWAQMWFQAGDDNRPMLVQTLMGKVHMQQHVQRLISLRAAVKDQRTASLAGAASSAGGGAASASTRGGDGGGGQRPPADPEAQLQMCTSEIAAALRDVTKPEEGLHKLLEAKDNHIFRGLSTLAAPGCTFSEAAAVGKDVLQRVGSKGPAAELARVLVARMTPNLLLPEALHAAMEEAEQSDDVQRFLVEIAGEVPLLLAQSLDQVAAMFEGEDPALCECAAKVLSRAGQGMARHRLRASQDVPPQLVERLKGMCAEGGPTAVKAAVKALVVLLPRGEAEGLAGDLADQLLARLKDPATLRHHGRLLATLKGLSMVGRLLPGVFEPRADEVLDFVVGDLMEADLSSGKPLPGVEAAPAAAAGRVWRRPSAVVAIKTAALRTLCQALVPDNPKASLSQAMVERATLVWELLEPLMDTDEGEAQFQPFQLVFPKVSDPEHAELQRELHAKRRRTSGPGSEELEEEGDEEGYLKCTDGAWVRFSAVCGLLRLARAFDAAMPAPLYSNLALTFQEPLVEPRRAMTLKLHSMVSLLASKREPALAQRAAKYAAILALFAVDPEERNRGFALRTLRDYVLQRRRVVERLAATAAATGSGGGSLVQEMPEFLLAFLVFLLAHHPDYPTPERLEEYSQAGEEEQLEMYGEGGPYAPFMGMLQFALEALTVPAEQPTSPAEVARLLPPAIKLLRTLKFCDDACSEPRTEEAHQLCDLGLMLLKQIADRLTGGKALEPARFPGQIVLPRLCYKFNAAHQHKRADGSDLPPARFFSPGLYEGDLFLRRMLIPRLPGPAAKARKGRSKPSSQRRGASGKGSDGAGLEDDVAADTARSMDEDASVGPSACADASDEEDEGQQPLGKRKAPAKQQRQRGGSKRSRPRQELEAGDREAEGAGAAAATAKRDSAKKPAGTPTRLQPRRGAKSDVAGKLKDASDLEEGDDEEEGWEEDEQPVQRQKRGSGPKAAAATQREGKEHKAGSDPGNALLGSPVGGTSRGIEGAGAAAARELRAGTDDEQAPTPASGQLPRAQTRQQRQDEESPGQENRAASNGAAARHRGRGKAKQAVPAAEKSAQAASTARPSKQGVKSQLKRRGA